MTTKHDFQVIKLHVIIINIIIFQLKLTSNGFNFAAWYLCNASCIFTAFCSRAGVVGGKLLQKWLSNSQRDRYKFRTSFSMSLGTNSAEKKNLTLSFYSY